MSARTGTDGISEDKTPQHKRAGRKPERKSESIGSGETEQFVQAARVENLTACLCCAKIHKNLGEFLLKLLVDLSIRASPVDGSFLLTQCVV